MTGGSPRRRQFLVAGLAGMAGAVAGCSGLGSLGDGGDDDEDDPDEPGESGPGWVELLSRLPRSAAVPGDRPPVVAARPARFAGRRDELPDEVVALAEHLATAGGLLPVAPADASAVAKTHSVTLVAAAFDRDAVSSSLADDGFRTVDGAESVYVGPDGATAVAVRNGWLAVGYHSGAAGAVETVAAADTDRTVDPGTAPGGAVAASLSAAAYAVVNPVAPARRTAPELGLFESERAYGVGVTLDGDEASVRYERRFDGSPPESGVDRWVDAGRTYSGPADPDVSAESTTVTVEGSLPAGDLLLGHLSGHCRDATAGRFPDDGPLLRGGDGRYEVYVPAAKFHYPPLSGDDVSFESGTEVTLHLTSRDVLHGLAVPDLGVRRLLLPGERTSVDIVLDDVGTHEVRCSHYCGAGHEAMAAELGVRGDVPAWIENAQGFDGTIADRRGETETTVRVGAETDGGPYSFDPVGLRVDPGTTVTFDWVSDNHTVFVESRPDGADWTGHEPVEYTGFSFEHTFETEGQYRYYCAPHKGLGMKGVVLVGPP